MTFLQWLQPRRRPLTTRRPGRPTLLPRLEHLEDRTAPAVLTVANTDDAGAGSLRDALAKAKDHDTIKFAKGLAGTIALKSELSVDDAVNIKGPGAEKLTINGDGKVRIFHIGPASKVAISGLTIANGVATTGIFSSGGGIDADCDSLTLTGDVFQNDKALGTNGAAGKPGTDALGGAVYFSGSKLLQISKSTFNGSLAQGGNGGAGGGAGGFASGGAVYSLLSPVTLMDDIFTENQAKGGAGGAGDAGTDGGAGTAGTNGGAGGKGGAALGGAVFGPNGLTAKRSTFTQNHAEGGAGGKGGHGGAAGTGTAGTATGQGTSADAGRGGKGGDGGNGNGGAVSVLDGTLTVDHGKLNDNQAVSGGGGAGGAGGAGGQAGAGANAHAGGSANAGNGGAGGGGGVAAGGALDAGGRAKINHVELADDVATGGEGGDGGAGGAAGTGGAGETVTATTGGAGGTANAGIGGAGGEGGTGLAGAIQVFSAFLTLNSATLQDASASGGSGGSGGAGGAGGTGGKGGDTLATGTGGAGGSANAGKGGNGGTAGTAGGGGVFITGIVLEAAASAGKLMSTHSSFTNCQATAGSVGDAGAGGAVGTAGAGGTAAGGTPGAGGSASAGTNGSAGGTGLGRGGAIFNAAEIAIKLVAVTFSENSASTSDPDVHGLRNPPSAQVPARLRPARVQRTA